ncbi:hypothetical protein N9C84_03590 [Desulfobacterales bacterium]|nr:hypothetical protein [Desulfobacterales bacterium]
MKSPVDRFGEAPRATPFGLARLPKTYLQERYQLSGIIIGLIYRMYINPIDYLDSYEYHRNITIEIARKSSGRIIMRDWRPGSRVLTSTLNPNPPTQQKLKRLTPAAIPHMNKGRKLQTGENRGDDFVG